MGVLYLSGRQVQQTAASRFIDVTLELGGNVRVCSLH